RVDGARLHTLPGTRVPLYGAALSAETAAWMAGWADGLITAAGSAEEASGTIDAFRNAGGGDRPVLLQVPVSYAATDAEAAAVAHDQWRQATLDTDALANLRTPEAFDAATADVTEAETAETMLTSADPAEHIHLLRSTAELGV